MQQFFADLTRDGVSAGNAKKISEVLSSALEAAVRTEIILVSPAANVAKPKPAEQEIVPFTPDEVCRILTAAIGRSPRTYSPRKCLAPSRTR